MIVGHMVFEAEVIEKRLLPVVQAPHHVVFPRDLFLRGNHRRSIKTTIFSTSASVKSAVAVLSAAGLFHRNSRLLAFSFTLDFQGRFRCINQVQNSPPRIDDRRASALITHRGWYRFLE